MRHPWQIYLSGRTIKSVKCYFSREVICDKQMLFEHEYLLFKLDAKLGSVKIKKVLVSSPLDCSECFTLPPPPPGRPVHSDTNSTSVGSILAMDAVIMRVLVTTTPCE